MSVLNCTAERLYSLQVQVSLAHVLHGDLASFGINGSRPPCSLPAAPGALKLSCMGSIPMTQLALTRSGEVREGKLVSGLHLLG